jgi:hypothetical protein
VLDGDGCCGKVEALLVAESGCARDLSAVGLAVEFDPDLGDACASQSLKDGCLVFGAELGDNLAVLFVLAHR